MAVIRTVLWPEVNSKRYPQEQDEDLKGLKYCPIAYHVTSCAARLAGKCLVYICTYIQSIFQRCQMVSKVVVVSWVHGIVSLYWHLCLRVYRLGWFGGGSFWAVAV